MQFEVSLSKIPIKPLNRYGAKDHLPALPKYAHLPVPVCHESKKFLLVTVGKMEVGPPVTTSRSSYQTTVSCVD